MTRSTFFSADFGDIRDTFAGWNKMIAFCTHPITDGYWRFDYAYAVFLIK